MGEDGDDGFVTHQNAGPKSKGTFPVLSCTKSVQQRQNIIFGRIVWRGKVHLAGEPRVPTVDLAQAMPRQVAQTRVRTETCSSRLHTCDGTGVLTQWPHDRRTLSGWAVNTGVEPVPGAPWRGDDVTMFLENGVFYRSK